MLYFFARITQKLVTVCRKGRKGERAIPWDRFNWGLNSLGWIGYKSRGDIHTLPSTFYSDPTIHLKDHIWSIRHYWPYNSSFGSHLINPSLLIHLLHHLWLIRYWSYNLSPGSLAINLSILILLFFCITFDQYVTIDLTIYLLDHLWSICH